MNDIMKAEMIRELQEGRPKRMHASAETVLAYFEAAQKVFPNVEVVRCGIRQYIVDMDNSEMVKRVEQELKTELLHHQECVNERTHALQDLELLRGKIGGKGKV